MQVKPESSGLQRSSRNIDARDDATRCGASRGDFGWIFARARPEADSDSPGRRWETLRPRLAAGPLFLFFIWLKTPSAFSTELGAAILGAVRQKAWFLPDEVPLARRFFGRRGFVRGGAHAAQPIPKYPKIPFAASRPSNTAVTTRSDPRTISPPANTFGFVV